MKKIILLCLINSLWVQYAFTQYSSITTESEFKAYFQKNKNEIEQIEGIYQLSFTPETITVNKNNGLKSVYSQTYNFTCIIYKSGNNFVGYGIEDKVIFFTLKKTVSPLKFLFSYSENPQLQNLELLVEDIATLKAIKSYRMDVSRHEYIDSNNKFTFTKTYPTSTDYQSITETQKSTGTGFAISVNGYIVTNYHVIENASSIKVRGINNDFSTSYTAKVIASDKNNDLVIIQINDSRFSSITSIPYSIRNSSVDVGESVFVLGYPLTASMGDEIKLTTGVVSAKSGFEGDITTYQMTAPIQPGNSGAPVFDKNGILMAVTNAKHSQAENAGYAIKTNYLKNLIESLPTNITFQTTNLLQSKPLTEQVKVLKKIVYIIEIN